MKETLKKIPFILLSHFFLLHNFDGQRLEVFIYRYTFSSFFKEDLFFHFTYIFFLKSLKTFPLFFLSIFSHLQKCFLQYYSFFHN